MCWYSNRFKTEKKKEEECCVRMEKKQHAWRFSSTSMKLFLFMAPLMVVSCFLAILGPKFSSWDFISTHSWLLGSSSGSNFNTTTPTNYSPPLLPSSHAKVAVVPEAVVAALAGVAVNNSAINISNSPNTIKVEIKDVQEPAKENELKVSNNSLRNASSSSSSSSSSIDLSIKTKHEKEYTSNLEKLEAGLQIARIAIKDSKNGNQTLEDSEYVPTGPMYWNPKVFHRSYIEMEKQFKVFVYGEGEPPVFHNGPCKSIYSMEGNFIHRMEIDDQFRTKDPEKAHVYFLPFSVTMMVRFVYVRDSHDFGPIRRTVGDYVGLIAGKYPYWNRSLGADHFMLACHDWGPETSFSVPHLGKNSIRALCNANTSERFNPMKDVSFPEINLQTGSTAGLIGGPSPSKRPILAFYAGGVHGPIRPILLEHWENKDDDIRVHKYLPKGVSYYEMMRKSKFCLCPSGYEVASPRVVEAFYTGCVPVLISDHYIPPFSDVLNWKSFSVEVPVSEIPNLKRILTSISSRQYIRMQRRLVKIRRHFEVNSPPKRYDVFHMILHSIWLRRLNVKIHNDEAAITS